MAPSDITVDGIQRDILFIMRSRFPFTPPIISLNVLIVPWLSGACRLRSSIRLQMESLLFLNEQSAKFMDWQVRILHPRIIKYQFTTRKNEVVNATRFQAYLVGAIPSEYVMATVPFSFKDETKPTRSSQRFQAKTCWKLSSVLLESNSKAQWNGCPNKAVVILDAPTQMNPLMQSGAEEKALSHFIEPGMKLADILEAFCCAKQMSCDRHRDNTLFCFSFVRCKPHKPSTALSLL